MSRSRNKFCKRQYCYGDDGEWFKDRRRHTRRINRQTIRNFFANFNLDFIADFLHLKSYKENQQFDDWNKPSDGTYLVLDPDDPRYDVRK